MEQEPTTFVAFTEEELKFIQELISEPKNKPNLLLDTLFNKVFSALRCFEANNVNPS
jgi:hypothetical protein